MEEQPLEMELFGYVDGNLDEDTMARVEAYLIENPEAAKKVRDYLQQNSALRLMAQGVSSVEPSQELKKLEKRLRRRLKRGTFFRWPHAAVLALFCGVAGWISNASIMGYSEELEFADQIVTAHSLTSSDPAEVLPVSMERMQKLFSRIGEPAQLPDLSAFGLSPVGAQLLPDGDGTLLHILYQDGAGRKLSYFIFHTEKDEEVPLHVVQENNVGMAYWQHDRRRYAIAGSHPNQELSHIARFLDRL